MDTRRAVEEDLEQISEILRKGIEKEPYSFKASSEHVYEFISYCFKNYVIYVAAERSKILGISIGYKYRCFDCWRMWIDELFVSEENQGRGIGRKLVNALETHFKKEGVKVSDLVTSCPHATKFYKKVDYKKTEYVLFEKKI